MADKASASGKREDKQPTAEWETAPDPDEDELDDLDDVLDEFAATTMNPKPPTAPTSAASATGPTTTTSNPDPSNLSEADFAAQLKAGMAELLGSLGEHDPSNPEMDEEFQALVKELAAAAAAQQADAPAEGPAASSASTTSPSSSSTAAANPKPAEPASFQDSIRATLSRLQESEGHASAAAASSASDDDDILAQMLREMERGNFGDGTGGGGDGASEEDFSKLLLGMMEQLTTKDILYEPLKELDDKYPAWLERNRTAVPPADWICYQDQHRLVAEIVARFERPGYRDEDPADRAFIVEKMQKMQAAGSPPPDLLGDWNAAQEALGELEPGCPVQ